jgi:hypothetical protein
MAKPNPCIEQLTAGMKKDIDETASTIKELSEYLGFSPGETAKRAKDKVDSGEWEQVWKKVGVRMVAAYRLKKK